MHEQRSEHTLGGQLIADVTVPINQEEVAARGVAEVSATTNEGRLEIQVTSENTDSVTGLRYTNSVFRSKQVELMGETLNQGGSILFIRIDLDNLKGLNDALGSTIANDGIRLFASALKDRLHSVYSANDQLIQDTMLYRPQAGGDEFLMMVRLKPGSDEQVITQTLLKALTPPVAFEYDQQKNPWQLTAQFGVAHASPKPGAIDNHYEVLQRLETESEDELAKRKMEKTLEKLIETFNHGRGLNGDHDLNIEELSKAISDAVRTRWGSRFPTDRLGTLLVWVISKTIALAFANQRPAGRA